MAADYSDAPKLASSEELVSSLKAKKSLNKAITTIVLLILSVIFILPLIWTISTSLKTTEQTLQDPTDASLAERFSVLWVPQSQEKAKVIDKDKPLYETKAPYDGKDPAVGELVSKLPNGKLQISIVTPTAFAGKLIEVAPDEVKDSPREGGVFTGLYQKTNVRVVALDDPKEGDTRFSIVEPANLAGTTFSAPKRTMSPVRHIDFQWNNFGKAFMHDAKDGFIPFLTNGENSILLVILTVSGVVVSNAVVAYSFAKLRWPGKDLIFAITIATMMIPFPVTMVPLFALFKQLGWIGTFRPLWVPAWFAGAFNIFLLRQFLMGIPNELSEAAKLDGCSEWQIFYRVVMPLAKPALAVVALFSFLGVWNDFMGPIIYLQDQHMFTLAVGLNSYKSTAGGTDINLEMAASTMVIAPIIVLYFFTQKLFIQGIAATGLKG